MSSQATRDLRTGKRSSAGLLDVWSLRAFGAALAVGAIAGLAVAAVGPVLTLVALLGLVVLALAFSHPEWVVVLVLAFASGLIPSRFNPFIDLFVARFQVSDLLLLWLLGVFVLRVGMNDIRYRSTPLDLPLVLFYAGVLVGLGTAVVGFGVRFNNATYEARTLLYYLVFFPITTLVRTPAQVARLAAGTVAVGLLMAVTMLLQTTLRPAILMAEPWMVQGEGLVRNFHPGFTTVYVALMILLGYVALREARKPRWLLWVMVLIMGAGLFSTLARNLPVAGMISVALLAILLRRPERLQVIREVLVLLVVAGLLIGIVAALAEAPSVTNYANAYILRIKRMFSVEIFAPDENLFSRWTEIEFALEKLRDHPILGIGLYNPYRPAFFKEEDVTLRHFIHNAYVGLWLKTGLLGLFSFLGLAAVYVRHSLARWRCVQDPFLRAVVAGCVVAFVGMLFTNFVAPSFIQPGSLAVFGVLLGLSQTILMDQSVNYELAKGDLLHESVGVNS